MRTANGNPLHARFLPLHPSGTMKPHPDNPPASIRRRNREMLRLRILVIAALLLGVTSAGWTYYRRVAAATELAGAAQSFLTTLSAEQRAITQLPYDSPQRIVWHFIPLETRKGLQLHDMSEPQRTAAHAVLKNALSQVGYEKATKIMS